LKFIKKINFIIGHLDRYNDFCKVPTTQKIHEKTILTAKQMLYNNSKVYSFINIHGCFGFITMILDFPNSSDQHDNYIQDIRDYILDLEATGYSVVLSGNGIMINSNQKNPSNNYNNHKLEQKVEVITEDFKGFKLKSSFEIEDTHYRRIKKKRLISRLNTREFDGKFSGLINITPKKYLV
jgi:hypothetical protein